MPGGAFARLRSRSVVVGSCSASVVVGGAGAVGAGVSGGGSAEPQAAPIAARSPRSASPRMSLESIQPRIRYGDLGGERGVLHDHRLVHLARPAPARLVEIGEDEGGDVLPGDLLAGGPRAGPPPRAAAPPAPPP